MKIFVCMDDTDNLESPGTGQLAQSLTETIEKKGLGRCSRVTRHQLFVHEDVPYTSHNSAMCFEAEIQNKSLASVIDMGQCCLRSQSAQGSDPGLCVAVAGPDLDRERLIEFGMSAKTEVLSKEKAYSLARETGIHLSEHGGTGDGVIGAVAGTGLRIWGDDGRYRGWYHFGLPGETLTVAELCAHDFIDEVTDLAGHSISSETRVILGGDKIKTVNRAGKQVVLVSDGPDNGGRVPGWITLTKEEVKQF